VGNAHEVYAQIEKKQPGASIELEVLRYDFRLYTPGRPFPDPEELTLKIDLVEEPAGTDHVWVPWTGVKDEDQARLGAYLADITQPLAQRF
jgi:hypothetical protein